MARNWVYTDLSVKGAVRLVIGDKGNEKEYEVTQYSASWACNEIPAAACMLAIGRNARDQTAAAIHSNSKFVQMMPAKVYFRPREEYSRDVDWPPGEVVIFEGFFTGFALRKINGKINVIANVIHWLAALGMSSSLTANGHVSNPMQLNAAAVLQALNRTVAPGSYIASLVPASLIFGEVERDLWGALKSIFCALANTPVLSVTEGTICGGDGSARINSFALSALNRIEGIAPSPQANPQVGITGLPKFGVPNPCDTPYVWGVPLALNTGGASEADDAIATAIGVDTIESYSGMSFWDKLVGQFCPSFGMAVVPRVASAVVIADTPVLRNRYWKQLKAHDYDSFDMTSELHRPLNAVGVLVSAESVTQASMEDPDNPQANQVARTPIVGGCFVESSVAAGDGMTIFVRPPLWLRSLRTLPNYSSASSGTRQQFALPTGTTASPELVAAMNPTSTPGTFGNAINALYERYAHTVYVNQMLRGRNGSFSGKLRFDIAPGSLVLIDGTPEVFIGAEDDLGLSMVGCVQRVTTTINAEAGVAGSTFLLSHLRTLAENKLDRTSVTRHPLFGTAIHGKGNHGCPLIDVYNLDE